MHMQIYDEDGVLVTDGDSNDLDFSGSLEDVTDPYELLGMGE